MTFLSADGLAINFGGIAASRREFEVQAARS